MVRACLAVAVLTTITPAFADDAPPPPPDATPGAPVASPSQVDPCGIQLRRAPDDARAVIVAALEADPGACGGALEVWIVASEGGLYVQARDGLGRVRERVVPDAATAAALLASWVEVDAAQPVWSPPVAPAAPPAAPAPTTVIASAAPGAVTVVAAPGDAVVAVASPRRGGRTRSIGVALLAHHTASGMDGGGARVDVDWRRWRGWQLGGELTALFLDGGDVFVTDPIDPSMQTAENARDAIGAMVTVRRPFALGRVAVAPAVGAGVGVSRHLLETWQPAAGSWIDEPYSVGPRATAAVSAGLRVVGAWHVEAGVETSMATYRRVSGGGTLPVWADGGTTVQLGVRYRP